MLFHHVDTRSSRLTRLPPKVSEISKPKVPAEVDELLLACESEHERDFQDVLQGKHKTTMVSSTLEVSKAEHAAAARDAHPYNDEKMAHTVAAMESPELSQEDKLSVLRHMHRPAHPIQEPTSKTTKTASAPYAASLVGISGPVQVHYKRASQPVAQDCIPVCHTSMLGMKSGAVQRGAAAVEDVEATGIVYLKADSSSSSSSSNSSSSSSSSSNSNSSSS